jgi:hypothetical protein
MRRRDEPDTNIENAALVLDLIEWVDARPRTYREVMDAWRTSCPRLPIWEDAVDLGFVERTVDQRRVPMVAVTAAGRAFVRAARAPAPADP